MEFGFDRSKHVFYSPDFEELTKDIIRFFNGTPVQPLPPLEDFEGAGVYALYYIGEAGIYSDFHRINRLDYRQPIYVGKAVPRGWRQGRLQASSSHELYHRLYEHTKSIMSASNLQVNDFLCRFVIFEDMSTDMIGTIEAALIRNYKPLWNCDIDGFGNHDPGHGRYNQKKSEWDVLHPGRKWADRCADSLINTDDIATKILMYFKNFRDV